MGTITSKIRDAVDQSEEEKSKMQQGLSILEKMVNYHLDAAKESMLSGKRNDQQIRSGTVVEFIKQVNINYYKGADDPYKTPDEEQQSLSRSINDFLGEKYKDGFKKLVLASVRTVLGNATIGEHEGTSMFIVWNDNALLRLDAYYYRWNFSSREIIQNVDGVSGVLVMKRVINLTQTDPQVLTWAISSQAADDSEATKMIDEAVYIIRKVCYPHKLSNLY